eukprot:CAMPEP_0172548262 /NCGR_PEP_ID=MMETSP1067-20121228/17600_1 /TAXON_ID=265564 ORGANISM="Thalassiosira punctigera, Strain Tpunct2005C2" /NCGR_SAMPLE_ID=MMETSP1067 /ASSEMBLY_ACC=CAM_ASM_000444 /LENGTH=530 /DNA_ID=CAMNT_0013335461 /DNA_START=44 /DNA_END=1636 /DNA_ORIENTATION=+
MPGYPAKPYSRQEDDETVNSDTDSIPPAEEKKTSTRSRLTTISRAYDLDGDGVLDEAEQAMRDRDVAGRGFLTNDEIYDIVQEQLHAKKNAGYLKKLVAGLICFVVLLAMSNLGTSLAAAFLAKDLKADEGSSGSATNSVPAVRIAKTGEIAAAQSTADVFDADPLTDEEFHERRRLVLREMDEDPHSHPHRRDLRARNQCVRDDNMEACDSDNRVTFDSQRFKDEDFEKIEKSCQKQKNVYVKRNWGSDSRNDYLCGQGTSIVVKESKGNNNKKKKKGGDKNNNKKNADKDKKKTNGSNQGGGGGNKKHRNREVIIERDDGRTLHAKCDGGICYTGGNLLQGVRGDSCSLNRDDCGHRLVCTAVDLSRLRNSGRRGQSDHGTCQPVTKEMTKIVIERAASGDYCNADLGWNACDKNMYCRPDDFDAQVRFAANGVVAYSGMGKCVRMVGFGQTCYSDFDCGKGNVCDWFGSGVGQCIRPRTITAPSGGCLPGGYNLLHTDCTNSKSCASGAPCMKNCVPGSDRFFCYEP